MKENQAPLRAPLQAPQPPEGGASKSAATPPLGGRGAGPYIAIMQPYFFPYIGYWQLIHAVDLFVVGDSVHYIKHGWINRNRILGEGGQPQYFGIEVSHASCNRLISETKRVVSRKQAEYLCRVLKFYYGHAPYYSEAMEVIKPILLDEEPDLTHYLVRGLRTVADYLGITTEFRLLSEVSDRWEYRAPEIIRRTCEHFGFTDYINPSGAGMGYYDKDAFREMGINLRFLRRDEDIWYRQGKEQAPQQAPLPPEGGEAARLETPPSGGRGAWAFVPDLSIIDLMMYCSRDEIHDMLDHYHFL